MYVSEKKHKNYTWVFNEFKGGLGGEAPQKVFRYLMFKIKKT